MTCARRENLAYDERAGWFAARSSFSAAEAARIARPTSSACRGGNTASGSEPAQRKGESAGTPSGTWLPERQR